MISALDISLTRLKEQRRENVIKLGQMGGQRWKGWRKERVEKQRDKRA